MDKINDLKKLNNSKTFLNDISKGYSYKYYWIIRFFYWGSKGENYLEIKELLKIKNKNKIKNETNNKKESESIDIDFLNKEENKKLKEYILSKIDICLCLYEREEEYNEEEYKNICAKKKELGDILEKFNYKRKYKNKIFIFPYLNKIFFGITIVLLCIILALACVGSGFILCLLLNMIYGIYTTRIQKGGEYIAPDRRKIDRISNNEIIFSTLTKKQIKNIYDDIFKIDKIQDIKKETAYTNYNIKMVVLESERNDQIFSIYESIIEHLEQKWKTQNGVRSSKIYKKLHSLIMYYIKSKEQESSEELKLAFNQYKNIFFKKVVNQQKNSIFNNYITQYINKNKNILNKDKFNYILSNNNKVVKLRDKLKLIMYIYKKIKEKIKTINSNINSNEFKKILTSNTVNLSLLGNDINDIKSKIMEFIQFLKINNKNDFEKEDLKNKLQKILSLAKEIVKIDNISSKKNLFLRSIEKIGFIKNLEPIPITSS